jgi:hypothetical protein
MSEDSTLLFAKWQNGELEATGLEAKARILLGWDRGVAEPLTDDEREFMRRDAYACDCNHPPEQAPDDDVELCRWWIDAMADYVNDMF